MAPQQPLSPPAPIAESSLGPDQVGYITQLPMNKSKLPDPDYDENERCYVRVQESEELAHFFQTVRSLALEKINHDPSLVYPQDIEKLKYQEWIIRRFMTHHKGDKLETEDPRKTAETIVKALMWKKKNRVRDSKPTEYPHEFFQIGLYGQAINRKGEFLVHCTASIYKRDPILTPHIKELINIMIEQIDNELDGRRIVIFLDLSGVPLRNADIGMVYYITLVALNYYRRIVKRCIVYEAPWYLSPFISMILAISPRYKALLTKVDRNNIFNVLQPEDIPESLGGKLCTKFLGPEGCISGVEFAARRGIAKKDLDRCLYLYGFSNNNNDNDNDSNNNSTSDNGSDTISDSKSNSDIESESVTDDTSSELSSDVACIMQGLDLKP